MHGCIASENVELTCGIFFRKKKHIFSNYEELAWEDSTGHRF